MELQRPAPDERPAHASATRRVDCRAVATAIACIAQPVSLAVRRRPVSRLRPEALNTILSILLILSDPFFQRKISGACRFSRPKKHFAINKTAGDVDFIPLFPSISYDHNPREIE